MTTSLDRLPWLGLLALLAAAAPLAAGTGPCVPDSDTLCLQGGRFAVTVAWEDFTGGSGVGHAVPRTNETGLFWFFHPDNLELAVKVLDGRAINDAFWVFYGALSNVRYEIRVRDVRTGRVRSYVNPSGTFASRGDTVAFPEMSGGMICDGIAGVQCPAGQRCEHDPGECLLADGTGTCEPIPEVCPEVFDPVCGCDGVTYENDCVRKAEGVQKDHDGAC